MNRNLRLAVCVLVSLLTVACNHGKSEDPATALVKECGDNNLSGPNILYFGPSNNIGPGSIWRIPQTGGYRVVWRMSDIPMDDSVIQKGTGFSCTDSVVSKFAAGAGIDFKSSLSPISANAKADFSRAKKIDVKATQLAWDNVVEGPYKSKIATLPESGQLRQDLRTGKRLVMIRALKISGYEADLDFGTEFKPELKVKYSGKLTKVATGDLGAEVTASWVDGNKLHLMVTGPVYVAGEFGPYSEAGFASATKGIFGVTEKIEEANRATVLRHD